MVSKAVHLIRNEWKLNLFFVLIITLLGCLPIFVFKGMGLLFGIILLYIGFDIYNGYFQVIGKILNGEKIDNPYKSIFFGKDKNRYDFFILIVFFSAIMSIFYGPVILFKVLFSQKLNGLLASLGQWVILYNLLIVICYTAYKVSFFSAIASLTYHKHEVLEAFKTGVKGIWRFKVILLVLLILEIALPYLVETSNIVIINIMALILYIVPAIIIFLMSCSYSLSDISDPPIKESVKIDEDNNSVSNSAI